MPNHVPTNGPVPPPTACATMRREGGVHMAKGQERPKKDNKPKLSTAEKQKRKKEKKADK